MISNDMITSVSATGMLRTLHVPSQVHPAHPIAAAAAVAAPRKRRAAAGTIAASVKGYPEVPARH
ncbi:hypothetical protein [Mycolicibacterium gilvum]|uniref:Uncharacterized protein n=1 Tax=Mycolicibacterium gilvum TaxID=1804 RepID=A0A378SI35_9MYCO|nr:hypothetical protein [Mycolicibacterium gilvum]MCV7055059.1 hypothetical protein [Mycolicibacterium gilvum]STZ42373.1 Uncharacterised protein [Mycolicibacterium gilvum]